MNKEHEAETTDSVKEDQGQLNLHKNGAGIYECRGRIQGHCPIHIPRKSLLAEEIA